MASKNSKQTERGRRRTLLTISQFTEEFPAFSAGSMRWLLAQRHANGFERAVVRLGRRVLVDVDAFFEWVDAQQGKAICATRDNEVDGAQRAPKGTA